jgi:hypothetical protein
VAQRLACSASGADPATCGDPNANTTCGARCDNGFCTGALDCSSLNPPASCQNGACINCQADADCGSPSDASTCGARCVDRLCKFETCGNPADDRFAVSGFLCLVTLIPYYLAFVFAAPAVFSASTTLAQALLTAQVFKEAFSFARTTIAPFNPVEEALQLLLPPQWQLLSRLQSHPS